ncbi:MAG: 23S rRNA (adenine(2030)-N(6))-methyltransferase RlmJ [Bdellovibrionales bacterium]
MLAYQHAYHAGSLADVHKHSILCCVLDYLTQKNKPLSYIETHAGRGLYDLNSQESLKTGEAKSGILSLLAQKKIPDTHPYFKLQALVRRDCGESAYPGSPLIACKMLRKTDHIHLAEMHPQEYSALCKNLKSYRTSLYHEDGFKVANALVPPMPRRGLILIDPSYEIKSDYDKAADFIIKMHKKWPVGVVLLWYPILDNPLHHEMMDTLTQANLSKTMRHEVIFSKKADNNHRLCGSGMFILNAPFGLEENAKETEKFL